MTISSVDLVHAAECLREAHSWISAGKPKKTIASLLEALDALVTRGDEDGGESLRLLRDVVGLLQRVCQETGREDVLDTQSEAIFHAGLRSGPLAERLVRRWALQEKRTDPQALEVYVSYLEARGRLDDALRFRLNQILAYALHVRLSSLPEAVAPLVPIIERLHRIRPRLTYPRLYLGRYHYLRGSFTEARRYLEALGGHLGGTPKVLNIRGRCAEKLGLDQEALDLYQRSLATDRHQPHIHFRVGRILLRQFPRHVSGEG